MVHFANSYWSPDYISGIDRLSKQSVHSLRQLHELRKFVYHHVENHHSTGEFLASLADSSYSPESSFWQSRGQRQVSGVRKISRQGVDLEPSEIDMNYVFRQFINHTANKSRGHQQLAAQIDTKVLEPLTSFLKNHEPVVRAALARMNELFGEYRDSYASLEDTKSAYNTMVRLAEFSIESEGNSTRAVEQESESEEEEEIPVTTSATNEYTYPLTLGATQFASHDEFAEFVASLVSSVAVSKWKSPFSAFGDDFFSSEDLCEQLTHKKRRGYAPTRSNLEKIGQALMDLRLIVPSRYFVKKFSSEGLSFKWSPAALQLANPSPNTDSQRNSTGKPALSWTQVTSSTSKTFNGVLKSMKSTLAQPKYSEEDLEDAELDYNDAYKEFQRVKYMLEMEIFRQAQKLEYFEKLKIDLVFSSLANLQSVLNEYSTDSSKASEQFSSTFSELNIPEVHTREFENTFQAFSTGIYFPSAYIPIGNTSATKLNTNFQNIKLNFNLFKDIPLQMTLGAVTESSPLSVQSVPVFLHKVIDVIGKSPDSELLEAWKEPLNYSRNHQLKTELITALQDYEPESTGVGSETEIEMALMTKLVTVFEKMDAAQQVGFVKSWLLDISDSVIPSTVYDSLMSHYKVNKNREQRVTEMLRLMSTIPRSNLSSLLFIMEHISRCSGFKPLEGYETGEVAEPTDAFDEKVYEVAATLNSTEAIASVPFLHLIMRPSVIKQAKGFKPPLEQYTLLLGDLMQLENRYKLLKSLVTNEKHYLERQEQQKKNLGIHKRQESRNRSTSINSATSHNAPVNVEVTAASPKASKAPNTNHLTLTPKPAKLDSFELRPFRTGTTPRPSPSSSPIHIQKRQDTQKSGSPPTFGDTL